MKGYFYRKIYGIGGTHRLKVRRFCAVAVLVVMLFTGSALASQVEDALSTRVDESIYVVLKLNDTGNFLRWLFSRDNINIFMPLILRSGSSNEIIGAVEMLSALIGNTPIKSAAIITGINRSDVRTNTEFFQVALKVDGSISSVVRKISDGSARESDIAKLILGSRNPLAALAETMIKAVREDDNIYRVNNGIFLKAHDDLILLGSSPLEINAVIHALDDPDARLFGHVSRKFAVDDFALLHVDHETALEFDNSNELDDLNISEIFAKPLNIEFGFKRDPEKFLLSIGFNFREALSPVYASKILRDPEKFRAVTGGNINLENSGGNASPLAALGTYIDIASLRDHAALRLAWNKLVREAGKRFGIQEEELANIFNGSLSLVVNGGVTVEGFRIPALYFSQTGSENAASKLFESLSRSRHFMKVRDGILQIDSSLSPVSCLISNNGETLNIDFAELSSLLEKPDLKPALTELMTKQSMGSLWIDFAGIQAWLNDSENGVFAFALPMATLMGYGKLANALRDVLNAKLSVPSMSLWVESQEIIHVEFAIEDVKAEDGILTQVVKILRDYRELFNR